MLYLPFLVVVDERLSHICSIYLFVAENNSLGQRTNLFQHISDPLRSDHIMPFNTDVPWEVFLIYIISCLPIRRYGGLQFI